MNSVLDLKHALDGWIRSEEGLDGDDRRRNRGELPRHRSRARWVASLPTKTEAYMRVNALPQLVAELSRMGWKLLKEDEEKLLTVAVEAGHAEAMRFGGRDDERRAV